MGVPTFIGDNISSFISGVVIPSVNVMLFTVTIRSTIKYPIFANISESNGTSVINIVASSISMVIVNNSSTGECQVCRCTSIKNTSTSAIGAFIIMIICNS